MHQKFSLFILLLLLTGSIVAQQKQSPATKPATTPKTAIPAKSVNKYNDNVDDRMKGPNGEKIYIGPNGGRYYLKGERKVYVEYKGSKKKKA